MILVDSSALVEYYRPKGISEVQAAVTEAIEADAAAVNGIIQVEVLAFVSGRASFDELLDDFKVFHRIALQETDFDRATEMGFSLRSRGVSVPPTSLSQRRRSAPDPSFITRMATTTCCLVTTA
ncbi:MAG: hypothetical protein ACJ76Y_18770 [Thermoanaerobaculia bacterium]